MPVVSNSRCKRSCNPCSLSSVLQSRAIFSASIKVATPELSIWVTPDKSMLTVLGCGACKRAISWSRTAGEESISMRPFKDARAPCSLATMLISGLSTRLLSPSNGIGSSPAQCPEVSMTDHANIQPKIMLASIWPLPGSGNCRMVKYLRRKCAKGANHVDSIRAAAPEYGHIEVSCA